MPAAREEGSSFGKYRLLLRLGQGAMGVVYLAEDTTLGRKVALKVLDPAIVAAGSFEQRFQQEARTIAQLDHPNIVRIHAIERSGDDFAIDMEWVEGGDLARAESEGRLAIRQVLAYTQDVLDALACCHDAGVVHRDVKPSNILLCPGAGARLSDFGLAKVLAEHQSESVQSGSNTSLFVGTPRYAPPESWDAEEPTPAWDLYSVGAVLFEAVAGQTPYSGATPLALLKQMLQSPPPSLREVTPAVSQELNGLVGHLLERDPGKRLRDAREALSRLQAVPEFEQAAKGAGSTMVRVKPKPSQVREVRAGRGAAWSRLRRPFWLAGAMLAVAAAATLWYVLLKGQAPNLQETVSAGAPSSTWVFDTIEPTAETMWPAHLLMLPTGEPNQWSVTAFESTRLWSMEAKQDELKKVHFSGNWAEYTDESALAFRYGTTQGTGYWLVPGEHMTLSLSFRSVQEGLEWKHSFSLSRSGEAITAEDFARGVMLSGYAQPILYRELVPRGLAWAEALETDFFAGAQTVTRVPQIRPELGGISVDGRLEEAEWFSAFAHGNPGILEAAIPHSAARMLCRASEAGLYLGLCVPGRVRQPLLEMALLGGFGIPASNSGQWKFVSDGTTTLEQRHMRRGKLVRWECTWDAAMSQGSDEWYAEVFVPFTSLSLNGPPEPGTRWRVNCAVLEEDGGGQPVARWGAFPADEVLLGALLVFGSDEP